MEDHLVALGLTVVQAKTYLYLLRYPVGRKPAQVADALGLTRTNAYKVLDQLCDFDLALKSKKASTYIYTAEDPVALTTFVAQARNHALELEKIARSTLASLQDNYLKNVRHAEISTGYGRAAVIHAYTEQIRQKDDIYFIKSRVDVPFMGFDTMHRIRTEPAKHGTRRHGITTASTETPSDPRVDMRSNLERTLISQNSYVSPVEWSVSKDTITIIKFTENGGVVTIKDAVLAESFREIWKLLDQNIRENPSLQNLESKNGRLV